MTIKIWNEMMSNKYRKYIVEDVGNIILRLFSMFNKRTPPIKVGRSNLRGRGGRLLKEKYS